MNEEEIIWEMPAPSEPSDLLDQAIRAIGNIHGRASNVGVLMSDSIYSQMRNEYLELKEISKTLTPSERLLVSLYLANGLEGISLLDFLLNILHHRE